MLFGYYNRFFKVSVFHQIGQSHRRERRRYSGTYRSVAYIRKWNSELFTPLK